MSRFGNSCEAELISEIENYAPEKSKKLNRPFRTNLVFFVSNEFFI